MNQNILSIVCPECEGNLFHDDKIHAEVSCLQCGLVLSGPSIYGFIYPGYKLIPRRKRVKIRSTISPSYTLGYNM